MKVQRWFIFLALLAFMATSGVLLLQAADHSDVPTDGITIVPEANITDSHAFVVGSNLVLAISTNAAIPPSASSYVFPTDVIFDVDIDVDPGVDTSVDPFGDGGTILDPSGISEEITFRIRFRDDGSARVQRIVRGAVQEDAQMVNFFAGLRDDPFIRAPRERRNIAAIVLEVPLSSIVSGQSTLLIWTTSNVQLFEGPHQEIAGRALRSMFPEQRDLNSLHPNQHERMTGLRPSVIIFDTSIPAEFPNGRALEDDVVDLACELGGECRVFNQPDEGKSGPKKNDVKFSRGFPYLAPPHPPT